MQADQMALHDMLRVVVVGAAGVITPAGAG